ncbi:MAG: RdgB/HAM1 family non-canonical purine NTP pyrophosphatase [Dehalococcoidia bacterium]|nr:RdgB/HAM1 family non-canonical purine NTP pyrophosphatase [Dehalococcoidia bacterium]
MPEIVIATNNAGKIGEFQRLLAGSGWRMRSPAELGLDFNPVEDGVGYAENALIKARSAHELSSMAVLADDSGIEVDALGGEPGVHSARYAGEGASDSDNRAKLLSAIGAAAPRTARFRCLLALIEPSGREHIFEGVVEGSIARAERGSNGFGYDPIFEPEGMDRTMAELDASLKDELSHRGRAARAALWVLRELAAHPI